MHLDERENEREREEREKEREERETEQEGEKEIRRGLLPPPPTAHGQAQGPGRGPAEAAPAALRWPPARGGPAGHPKGERGGTGGQQPPLPTRQPRPAAWAGLLPPPGCGQGGAAHCAGRRGRRRLGWPPATPKEREKGGAQPLLRLRTGCNGPSLTNPQFT